MQLVNLVYNHACCVSPRRGPAAALPLFEESLQLARRHGCQPLILAAHAAVAACHSELGEWDCALEELAEAADSTHGESMPEPLLIIQYEQARLLVQLGRADEAASLAASLAVAAAGALLQQETTARCYALAAAVYVALKQHDLARHLLEASLSVLGWQESADAGVVRSALACGDFGLAERLAERFKPLTTKHRNVLAAADGLLEEARGAHDAAAVTYADAAARWRDFGVPYEEAQALLDRGVACLRSAGRLKPRRWSTQLVRSSPA